MYLRCSTVKHLSLLSFKSYRALYVQTLCITCTKLAILTPYLNIQTELIFVTKDVKGN